MDRYVVISTALIVSVYIINYIKNRSIYRKLVNSKEGQNALCKAEEFLREINVKKTSYITNTYVESIQAKYKNTYDFFNNRVFSKIKEKRIERFKQTCENFRKYIDSLNEEYIKTELNRNKALFDNIDGNH